MVNIVLQQSSFNTLKKTHLQQHHEQIDLVFFFVITQKVLNVEILKHHQTLAMVINKYKYQTVLTFFDLFIDIFFVKWPYKFCVRELRLEHLILFFIESYNSCKKIENRKS